jgi:AraC-like DNA-binding protein
MHNSVVFLAAATVFVPLAIFTSGYTLVLFSVILFGAIYYCILHFYRYSVSATPQLVDEADMSELPIASETLLTEEADSQATEQAETSNAMPHHVEEAVALWTKRKGYLHKKATLQRVANEMDVTRNQLTAWLKNTDRVFNHWINSLRIEEAKRLLKEHPNWTNDSIANACGFGSRSYFQTVFKENTGMTPAQFVERDESQ